MLHKILGFLCLGAAIMLILSQLITIEYIEEDGKDD
jgi:hypothetical protein